MATVFDSLPLPDGWSKAYVSQIASYVRRGVDEGLYYGNKIQYEKRQSEILEWIENIENTLYEDGSYVFKKKKAGK